MTARAEKAATAENFLTPTMFSKGKGRDGGVFGLLMDVRIEKEQEVDMSRVEPVFQNERCRDVGKKRNVVC